MKSYDIKGQIRENLGKKESKKLRAEGHIPCVIYGGKAPVHFAAEAGQFRNLVYTPDVYMVNVDLGDVKQTCVMQEIQFHPVNDNVLHVDFIEVQEGVPVKMEIPVNLIGTSAGERAGGKVRVNYRRLSVKGMANDLPETLDVNVEELAIGQSIRIRDLEFTNLELLDTPSDVVVAVKTSRKAMSAAAAEEADGGEEGEGEEALAAEE